MKVKRTMKHNNYSQIQAICPHCKHPTQIRDHNRQETYCPQCGLITQDNTIPSILTEIQQNKNNKTLKTMQKLWRTIKLTRKA